jgi:hypothetical protein
MHEDKTSVNNKIVISIDEVGSDFTRHIDELKNSRIVFSGRFGIGKTYFLREFFKKNNNKYEVVHLFPVNYQISQNDDIVNLLQYDILLSLMDKFGKNLFSETEDILEILPEIILPLLYLIPQVAQATLVGSIQPDQPKTFIAVLFLAVLTKLGKKLTQQDLIIKSFQSVIKKENKKLTKFLSEMSQKSLSSKSSMSDVISNGLDNIKGGKKTVLIIDDLDRVDPEHIFRLLNVFSACFDYTDDKQKNLFGFDKVIIVSDFNNLESIFHHRYGVNADFNGYFDKFFSAEVFYFDNRTAIKEVINEIISNLQYNSKDEKWFKNTLISNIDCYHFLLDTFLTRAVNLGELNLRQLIKGTQIKLVPFNTFSVEKVGMDRNFAFQDENRKLLLSINICLDILTSIFGGDSNRTLQVLQNIKQSLSDEENNIYFQYYMTILARILLRIKTKDDFNKNVNWDGNQFQCEYTNGNFSKPDSFVKGNTKLFFSMLVVYYKSNKYKIPINEWWEKEYIQDDII